jgi:hypothetical protein
MPSDNRKRHYCFVWHDYDDVTSVDALQEFFDSGRVKYLVYGKEICPETRRPHLQGYMSLKEGMSMTAIIDAVNCSDVGGGLFLLEANGSADDNRVYCTADGDFVEYGKCPKGGAVQCRLLNEHYREFIEMCETHQLNEVKDKYPQLFVRYHAAALRMNTLYAPKLPSLEHTCGEWWVGPAGTGKSHEAVSLNGYDKKINKWFDGYVQGEAVIIQDLDPVKVLNSDISHNLKIWADKYPFTAEVKGGTMKIRPPVVIVTSQYKWEDLFHGEELQAAIQDRFKVRHFNQRHAQRDKRPALLSIDDLRASLANNN